MKRRKFITLLGGAAVAWPLAARAQQRRADAAHGRAHEPARRTIRTHRPDRGAASGAAAIWLDHRRQSARRLSLETLAMLNGCRRYAADLVAPAPDVIVATVAGAALAALQQATRIIPIVFAGAIDPVGAGVVASLGAAERQRHRVYLV